MDFVMSMTGKTFFNVMPVNFVLLSHFLKVVAFLTKCFVKTLKIVEPLMENLLKSPRNV